MRYPLSLLLVAGLCSIPAHAGDEYDAPASYYSNVDGTGLTLKSQLQAAMSNGHVQRNYGNFRDMSRYIDTDPNNPSNILLVYNRASVSGSWDSGSTWNREHVWPQSLQPGSASNSSTGNLGDPHALRPANPSINSSRGNKPFGGGANTTGNHRSLGTYYFPGDADKGDIARSLFYSNTRYSGLTLVNGTPGSNQMGDLESLIAWHYLDIPDTFERRRNHAVFSPSLNPLRTNNRNAYIDHPEFVWSIYVDQMNDTTLFLGDLEPADGGSTLDVNLGAYLVGETIAPITIDLNKSGDDATYYRVSPTEGITTNLDGCYQAFPIGSATSTQLDIAFDSSLTANNGLSVSSITIDNLDVTDQGGAGNGANDANDTVNITATVFEPGNASFDDTADTNTLELDLGTVNTGSGPVSQQIAFYNIPNDLFIAPIDIELISSVGDTSAITTDFAPVLDLTTLDFAEVQVSIDDSTEGVYNATYTFRVYNARSMFPGDVLVEDLTLNVTAEVSGAVCSPDLNNDGVLNFFDVSLFLNAYSNNDPAADFTNDGVFNFFDVSAFLNAYSAGCP